MFDAASGVKRLLQRKQEAARFCSSRLMGASLEQCEGASNSVRAPRTTNPPRALELLLSGVAPHLGRWNEPEALASEAGDESV